MRLQEMTRPFLVLLMGVCLCSCAAVPLTTLLRMSVFDERDFAELDPEVLRVRIALPEAFALDVPASRLGVEIASAAGAHESRFELDQVTAQDISTPGGLLSRPQRGIVYELRLSALSCDRFRELQRFVAKGRTEDITIIVAPRLSSYPDDAQAVEVSIDLLLSQAQGYFTLVEGAEISLGKARAKRSGS